MRLPIALLAVAALAAAAGPKSRPARTSDLPGVWIMADLTHSGPVDPEDKVFAPHQIFEFDQKGGMKHMTSPKPFTRGQLELFHSAPRVTRYGVDKTGVLVLSNPSWDTPLKYQCRFVTKSEAPGDLKVPQAGDILLSSVDDQGREAWSKVLRKAP